MIRLLILATLFQVGSSDSPPGILPKDGRKQIDEAFYTFGMEWVTCKFAGIGSDQWWWCDGGRQRLDIKSCTDCAPGFFSMGGCTHKANDGACRDCNDGFYPDDWNMWSGWGALACMRKCVPGTFGRLDEFNSEWCRNDNGQHKCDGPFSMTTNGNGECNDRCPVGKYQNEYGKDSCKVCEAGKYNNHVGSGRCESCAPGKYNEQVGGTACKDCADGKYSTPGRKMCVLNCPRGTYLYNRGTPALCLNCAAGKYNHQLGNTTEDACTVCPVGTYNDQEGQAACKNCTKGKYNDQSGSTAAGRVQKLCQGQIQRPVWTSCLHGLRQGRVCQQNGAAFLLRVRRRHGFQHKDVCYLWTVPSRTIQRF
jgi:hypothetical protein